MPDNGPASLARFAVRTFERKVTTKQPHATTGVQNTGPQSSVEYDVVGNLVKSTDPLNRVTTYAYDELGRLESVTAPDPDGPGGASAPVTHYGYNKLGETTSVTDALSHVTTYAFDYRGRMTFVTHPDPDAGGGLASPEEEYEYDAASQLLSRTDAMEHVTTYDYDQLGRTILMTSADADGVGGDDPAAMAYEFDAVSNLLAMEDVLAHRTAFVYDSHDNVVTTIDADLKESTATFDDLGNMLTSTDPESNTTTWVYDLLNRVTTETNELNDDRLYEYDLAGNLIEKTDRNGLVTQYTHDHLHRLTAELWKNGGSTVHSIAYGYDAASQLTSAGDGEADYDYVYDGLGRVTSITADLGGLTPNVILTQGFDLAGNRISLATTIGSTADSLNTYTYDNLDRLKQVTQAGQGGGNAVAEKRVNFAYNAASQFDTITRYADTAGTALVATSTFAYDAANRLTDLDHARSGTPLAGYDLGYDESSRLTTFGNTQHSAQSATIGYDDVGRVTSVDRSGGANDEAYVYDDAGNRDSANGDSYTIDPDNQIQSDGVNDYIYDFEGNRLSKEFIATGAREEYEYDYRNRLTKVTFRNPGGSVVKTVENSYDLLNRWVRRTHDSDGPGGAAAADEFFLSDGGNISLAFDDSAATDVSNRFVWGSGGGGAFYGGVGSGSGGLGFGLILADEAVSATSSNGDTSWSLTDHNGSGNDLVNYISGGGGAATIVGTAAFSWFGIKTSSSGVDSLFEFGGKAYDSVTLLSPQNEVFDPNVGGTINYPAASLTLAANKTDPERKRGILTFDPPRAESIPWKRGKHPVTLAETTFNRNWTLEFREFNYKKPELGDIAFVDMNFSIYVSMDEAAIKDAGLSLQGIYGHEQLHVKNFMNYLKVFFLRVNMDVQAISVGKGQLHTRDEVFLMVENIIKLEDILYLKWAKDELHHLHGVPTNKGEYPVIGTMPPATD